MLYKVTFLMTFALIALVTIRRSGGVHSAADFSVANRSLSCTGVSWVIIGTLVGGVSCFISSRSSTFCYRLLIAE